MAAFLFVAFLVAVSPPDARSTPPLVSESSSTRGPSAQDRDADAGSQYETVVRDSQQGDGLDAQRRLDARCPGFATAIEVDHESGARPADALPEILARAPSVTVRSMGGLGQFSSISLRGSSAQQVSLFLDGFPIDSGVGGLIDVSTLPLDALERVEIYRGHIPVAFGSSAIGGAVNLINRANRGPNMTSTHFALGSFGALEARVAARMRTSASSGVSARAGYAGAAGDFPFYNDNGRPDLPAFHTISKRRNNGFDRIFSHVAWAAQSDLWTLSLQQIASWKHQGLSGVGGPSQTSQTNLKTLRLMTIASAKRRAPLGPGSRFNLVAGLALTRSIYRDLAGELGNGVNDDEIDVANAYLSPRLRLALWRGAFLTGLLGLRLERTGVDNRIRGNQHGEVSTGDARRSRTSYAAGLQLEQFLFGRRLVVVPTLHADLLDSRFRVKEGEGEFNDSGTDHITRSISPRIGARLRLADDWELRGSFGRYLRAPNMMELFGDRGFVDGNPGLQPETGTSVDFGVVADLGEGGPFGLYGHAALFGVWSKNLIQWEGSSVLTARNVSAARVAGIETGASARAFGRVVLLHANYTYLDAENRSEKTHEQEMRLAGRPEHEVFARVSMGYPAHWLSWMTEPRIFYTAEYIAGNYLGPSGRTFVPSRSIHGVGAELLVGRSLRIAFEVRNLLNRLTSIWRHPAGNLPPRIESMCDFPRYPLPGRSLWLSVNLQTSPQGENE